MKHPIKPRATIIHNFTFSTKNKIMVILSEPNGQIKTPDSKWKNQMLSGVMIKAYRNSQSLYFLPLKCKSAKFKKQNQS